MYLECNPLHICSVCSEEDGVFVDVFTAALLKCLIFCKVFFFFLYIFCTWIQHCSLEAEMNVGVCIAIQKQRWMWELCQIISYTSILCTYKTLISCTLFIYDRLKTALDSAMSLELGPRGLHVFEDYTKGTTGNGKKTRQVIPGMSLTYQLCSGPHLNHDWIWVRWW